MLKSFLKNKMYMVMLIGIILSFVSLITTIFVKSETYFTIMFIVNIIINFLVTGTILLLNQAPANKFKWIVIYLLITLFFLFMDVVIINNTWNLMDYSLLMYAKNMQLYLGLYSVYVLLMALMSVYVILKSKSINNDTNIRQKSSKQ